MHSRSSNHFMVYSQPLVGEMPAGNLLFSTAITLSGETFQRMSHFCRLINIRCISQSVHDRIQKEYVLGAIGEAWDQQQNSMYQSLGNSELKICGDGRCDSPGFSAKYCLYSHMDMGTNKLLNLTLVQVTDAGNASARMEALGYVKSMDSMIDSGLNIKLCATDRHVQIRKVHREKYLTKKFYMNLTYTIWQILYERNCYCCRKRRDLKSLHLG